MPLALLARDCIIPAVTHTIDASAALRRANEFPSLSLAEFPTPIEELKRLRSELGSAARILSSNVRSRDYFTSMAKLTKPTHSSRYPYGRKVCV